MATLASSGRVAPPYSRPSVQATGSCIPVLPLDQCDMHLGQNLARCPRTTREVGWWLRGFRRASSTVLAQRACHRHVAPRVVCVLGLSQLVVLTAARRPPRPTHFGDVPRKDALDARLPPPASRHARSGDRTHDLSVVRPTLSPVELAGDPCVCVWASMVRLRCPHGALAAPAPLTCFHRLPPALVAASSLCVCGAGGGVIHTQVGGGITMRCPFTMSEQKIGRSGDRTRDVSGSHPESAWVACPTAFLAYLVLCVFGSHDSAGGWFSGLLPG